jgi:hypothetical protein
MLRRHALLLLRRRWRIRLIRLAELQVNHLVALPRARIRHRSEALRGATHLPR